MTASLDVLFEEFVAAWTRGEPLELNHLRTRAGSDAEELSRLVDAFLVRAPRREPSEEAKQAIAAIATDVGDGPPLLVARVRARMRVRDVAKAIVVASGLPQQAEELVRDYYLRLEGGLLDPRGVSDRIWAVLSEAITPGARKLAAQGYRYRAPGLRGSPAFERVADAPGAVVAAAVPEPSVPAISPELEREVEGLFTGQKSH